MSFFRRIISLLIPNGASSVSGDSSSRTLMLEPKWSVCTQGSKHIPISDLRHVDHDLWKRWRQDVQMDSPADAIKRIDLEAQAKTNKPPRQLMLEPKWSRCIQGGKKLSPSDTGHVDHNLWLKWQKDVLEDSPDEKQRRAIEEMELHFTHATYLESILDEPSVVMDHSPRTTPVMALVQPKSDKDSDEAKARLAEQQRLRREAYAKQREQETSKDESIRNEEDDARAFFLAQRKRQMAEAAQQNRQQDEEITNLATTGGTLLANSTEQGASRFDFFLTDEQNSHVDRAKIASEC